MLPIVLFLVLVLVLVLEFSPGKSRVCRNRFLPGIQSRALFPLFFSLAAAALHADQISPPRPLSRDHHPTASAQHSVFSDRFVVDDDEFEEKVVAAGLRLLKARKLIPADKLHSQVRTVGASVPLAATDDVALSPPEVCERLRQSTLAIGSFYKCPDCGQWHFNSSAGFLVSSSGVLCTCCHVVVVEDKDVKESYLIAADSDAHVYPVQSVLAADVEADTCFLKISATSGDSAHLASLKPLGFRAGIRPGEKVFCLSNPGGFHFMFTEGIVARVNRRRDMALDADGHTNGLMTRPMLYLNITAEFAPGSSGAAIVDQFGNVVAQVSSISEAGEPDKGDDNTAPSPSVPIRFCIATEEIMGLVDPDLGKKTFARETKAIPQRAIHMLSTNHPPRKP